MIKKEQTPNGNGRKKAARDREHVQTESIPIAGRVEKQRNRYYLRVSRRYMVAAVLVLLLLVLYIMCVTVFFGEYVTYDNLKYLLRDMDAITVGGHDDFERIVYNASENTEAEYFRNGIALCDTDKYRYYDTSGVMLVEEELGYKNPVMVSSEKYMLVYDLDGRGYSIFNQLTRIIDREAEGSIIAADICEDGSYIIVIRSNETKYVAQLYNGAYNKVLSVYKDSYVFDVALSRDGRTAVICSICPGDSDFDCEIDICERGKNESVKKISRTHTMPLDAYAYDGGFAVLCSNEIMFFDEKGNDIRETVFNGMSLRYADINGKTAAVAGTTNALGSENRVIVFDMENTPGNVLLDREYPIRIMGIYASRSDGSAAYLKLHDTVARIGKDGEIVNAQTESEILTVVPMNTGALVCTSTAAYRISD